MSLLLLLACDAELIVKLEGLDDDEESNGSSDPGVPGDPGDPGDPVEEEVEPPPEASCVAVERMTYSYAAQGQGGWQQQTYVYKLRHTYDAQGREVLLEQNYDRRPGYESSQWTTFDAYGNILVIGYSSQNYIYEMNYYYLYDDEGRVIEVALDYDDDGYNESVTLYLYSDSGLSRKVVNSYDDGYSVYQSVVDELLDQEGRVLQQESDYDFDGRADYRTSYLYAGDLLLTVITESWYMGQHGQQYSYSQVVDYEYDRYGFRISESWDYGNDGYDTATTYANDAAGNPLYVVYYMQAQMGGPLVPYLSTINTYDTAGRILTSSTSDSLNSYTQSSKWKWRCP